MCNLFRITRIDAGYGKKQVLFDISVHVNPGEFVALIGPNGAGKSTVLKVCCGLISSWRGEITFADSTITFATAPQNVERGIVYCPQGRRIFSELTVYENLELGGRRLGRIDFKKRVTEVYSLFPKLEERTKQNAGTLSGGEQQQLSVARSLILGARLLLLDEPSLGLSPGLIKDLLDALLIINREKRIAMLVVEQKVKEILPIVDRVYSLKLGRIAYEGDPRALIDDREKLRDLFL